MARAQSTVSGIFSQAACDRTTVTCRTSVSVRVITETAQRTFAFSVVDKDSSFTLCGQCILVARVTGTSRDNKLFVSSSREDSAFAPDRRAAAAERVASSSVLVVKVIFKFH